MPPHNPEAATVQLVFDFINEYGKFIVLGKMTPLGSLCREKQLYISAVKAQIMNFQILFGGKLMPKSSMFITLFLSISAPYSFACLQINI